MKGLLLLAVAGLAAASDGLSAWLRCAPIANAATFQSRLPSSLVALNTTARSPVQTAAKELAKGLGGKHRKPSTKRRDSRHRVAVP